MENPETHPPKITLLEAFKSGMEVTVCEAVRVDLGPTGAVVFPAGAKLTERAGYSYSVGSEINPNDYIIVVADSGFEVMLPHTEAKKIMVE